MADFAQVSSALLARAESVLPEWLGGKRAGNEWTGERTANGGPGDSWTVNLTSGAWMHGAGNEKGGDLVSLFAALRHLGQKEACEELAKGLGLPNGSAGHPHPHPPRAAPPTDDPGASGEALPAPPGAGEPPQRHGQLPPDWYRSAVGERLFAVVRIEEAQGKRFLQWTWRGGRWVAKAWPKPRPLYRLDVLTQRPLDPVLIVEGEKCVAAAQAIFPDFVVTTWAQGANSVDTADFSSLKERDVTVWPDADEPGNVAASKILGKLLKIAETVSVINVKGRPEGWDVADFAAEAAPETVRAFMAASIKPMKGEKPKEMTPAAPVERSGLVTIQDLGLLLDYQQRPIVNLTNVSRVLQKHTAFTDHLWYDTFREAVWHDFHGAPAEWTDSENRQLTVAVQQMGVGLERLKSSQALEAVYHASEMRKRNSVTVWLETLKWDGTERLRTWLSDFFGAPQDEIREAIGTNWLVSMVRRAYHPGCQMDYVIVLEGEMGLFKTSAVEILGAPWHASLSQKFGSKEFNEALRARWLVEIPEMTSLQGVNQREVNGVITRRTDIYRVPWDRLASEHPRRCVFVITTEERAEYLTDTFGIRRIWPVPCTEINREALRDNRDQLFAEAMHLYGQGHLGYEVPDALREEQLERVSKDLYHDRMIEWLTNRQETTNLEIYEAIFAPRDSYGNAMRAAEPKDQARITKAMRRIGWVRTRMAGVRGWRRPPVK